MMVVGLSNVRYTNQKTICPSNVMAPLKKYQSIELSDEIVHKCCTSLLLPSIATKFIYHKAR